MRTNIEDWERLSSAASITQREKERGFTSPFEVFFSSDWSPLRESLRRRLAIYARRTSLGLIVAAYAFGRDIAFCFPSYAASCSTCRRRHAGGRKFIDEASSR